MKLSAIIGLTFACLLMMSPLAFPQPAEAAVSSWIKSASFIPLSNTEFSSDRFRQSVRNFQAIGGNYVNLVIPYYQSNSGSTDINPGWNTPTDASLISGIQYVHSLGMKVQLSVYLETYSGEWRATINPGDRSTWYARYGDVLVRYGQIAEQNGVELYQLGAELINMTSSYANGDNTARWSGMISRVRGVYSRALTYSANRPQSDLWQSEANHIGFWGQLNYVGVSAYYELFGDGSVASLKSDWQALNSSQLSQLAQYGKPVIFTEIGYKSVSGAHDRPWDSGTGGPYDAQEQVRDYTALLEFWNDQSYMQGVVLWWWSPDPNYGGSGNIDYTPQNKPAQDVLRQWWTGGASPPVQPPSGGPVSFTASGSASPADVAAGQSVALTATLNDTSGAASSIIVDLEVYSGGAKVFQRIFDNQAFSSGQSKQYSANWVPSASGSYTFKVGAFSGDWSQNYVWNDHAASITVGSVTPPPTGEAAFRAAGSANPASPSAGQQTALAASVTQTSGSTNGAIIDLEVYSGGTRVFQHFTAGQDFSTGQTREYVASWVPTAAGTYSYKLGVFNADWSKNYYWNDALLGITATSGSSPPQNPTAPPSGSPTIVMVNGYPTINGNFVDCNGNIDNDASHHTTNPSDTDPAHHVGQNCSAGSLVGPRP